MNSKESASPPRVWIAAFALFAAFQVCLAIVPADMPAQKRALVDSQVDHLAAAFSSASSDTTRVLVIGSSLTPAAIVQTVAQAPDMSARDADVIVLRTIALSGHRLQFLTNDVGIFDRILELPQPPDAVLIQSELLTTHFSESSSATDAAFNLGFTRSKLKALVWPYTGKLDPYLSERRRSLSAVGPVNPVPKERDIQAYGTHSYAHPHFKRLRDAGIRIFVLDIPKSIVADRQIHSGTLESEFQKALSRYRYEFDMKYWKYTGPDLNHLYFRDEGHMNAAGSKLYTRWLIEKIALEFR